MGHRRNYGLMDHRPAASERGFPKPSQYAIEPITSGSRFPTWPMWAVAFGIAGLLVGVVAFCKV